MVAMWPTARSSETETPFAPIVTVSMVALRIFCRAAAKPALCRGCKLYRRHFASAWSRVAIKWRLPVLPLIALPGTSPRIATGEGAGRSLGAMLAMLQIGEIVDERAAPRHYTGREGAGRQVRGSACLEERATSAQAYETWAKASSPSSTKWTLHTR